MKSLLFILLSSLICTTSIATVLCDPAASARTPFAGGDGTAANPYGICTLAQLADSQQVPFAFYQLWTDIDASSTQKTQSGWLPLFSHKIPFTGFLDGMGHTINHLSSVRPNEDDVGLLRSCMGCTIQNLALRDVVIVGRNNPGALIGRYVVQANYKFGGSYANLRFISVDGSIQGDMGAGGVLGYVYNVSSLLQDEDFINDGVNFEGVVKDKSMNRCPSEGCSSTQLIGESEYD